MSGNTTDPPRSPERIEQDSDRAPVDAPSEKSLASWLSDVAEAVTSELGDRVMRLAMDATGASMDLGRALLSEPPNPSLAKETGAYLRELRELAGLTVDELSAAVRLEDQTLLEAVEQGTAAISFELILRLAAILARHDPVPFLIQMTRSYNPEIWRMAERLGFDRLPVQYERERRFINIYRSHDGARRLSEDGFLRVLEYTDAAFAMALHFVEDQDRRSTAETAATTEDPSRGGDDRTAADES